MVNDIEISPDRFCQGNHGDKFFFDIPFHQQIGKHGDADALRYAADNRLRTGTLPHRTDRNLPKGKGGVKDFSAGAAVFPHEKGIFGQPGEGDFRLSGQRVPEGDDGAHGIFHERFKGQFRVFRLRLNESDIDGIIQDMLFDIGGLADDGFQAQFRVFS